VKEISISEWRDLIQTKDQRYTLIDVRAPIEYMDAHIPGAINIPLFSDDERAVIGTIFKQEGNKKAKWKAMEVVSPKIPSLLQKLNELTVQGTSPLIYCWRGGSRSGSFCTFAELVGLEPFRLTGGYRAYREWCVDHLSPDLVKGKVPVILHGMTGVGKTLILKELAGLHPTLDLEQMANHRGSIFGQFGIQESHNQKTFDSLLLEGLLSLQDASYIIMEAESRRIGKVSIPDFFMEWRKNGIHILLETSMEYRIQVIMKEYVEPFLHEEWFQPKVWESYHQIKKRMSIDVQAEIEASIESHNYSLFIQLMLEKYYDSKYQFHESDYVGKKIDIEFTTHNEAVQKIHDELKKAL
jgi:tRNA 2-selenouridine synthase